jgi:hypothetical protein
MWTVQKCRLENYMNLSTQKTNLISSTCRINSIHRICHVSDVLLLRTDSALCLKVTSSQALQLLRLIYLTTNNFSSLESLNVLFFSNSVRTGVCPVAWYNLTLGDSNEHENTLNKFVNLRYSRYYQSYISHN